MGQMVQNYPFSPLTRAQRTLNKENVCDVWNAQLIISNNQSKNQK